MPDKEEFSPPRSRALMLLQGLCRSQLRPLENWSYFRPLVCGSIPMRMPWPATAPTHARLRFCSNCGSNEGQPHLTAMLARFYTLKSIT